MRPAPFDYEAPATVADAAELLAIGQPAVVLAGGQTLMPRLIRRAVSPRLVVDINRISGLGGVEAGADGDTVLGALVRHQQLVRSPELRARVPLLCEAAGYVSNPVVRRRGTVGGSVAWRDGRSEIAAALLACDADLVVHSRGAGARRIAIGDALAGREGQGDGLGSQDLIAEVVVPGAPDTRESWGVAEVSVRRWDPAVGGAVCRLGWRDSASEPEAVRVVAFGELDRPRRLADAEAAVAAGEDSTAIGAAAAREVAGAVLGAAGGEDSHAAAVVGDSVRRAVDAARARAQGGRDGG